MTRPLETRLRRLETATQAAATGMVVIRARTDQEADVQVRGAVQRGEMTDRDLVVTIRLFGDEEPTDGFGPYRIAGGVTRVLTVAC